MNISAYASEKDFISNFPTKLITDVATLQRGDTITKKDVIEGDIPVIAGGKKPAYFHNQPNRECGSITISSSGAYAGYVAFHEKPIFASDCFTAISKENSLDQKFLFYLLKSKQELIYKMQTGGGQPHVYAKNFNNFEIPCPPVEIQKNIVDELDNYQKIIDGCNQVIKNYKPNIEINPSWEMVELQYLIDKNLDSKRVPITKNVRKSGIIPYYGASGIVDHVEDYLFDENLLLISEDGANLKDRNYPIAFSVSGKCWVNNHAHVLRFKEYDIQKFIEFYFNQISLEPHLTGSAQPKLNQDALNKIKIPCPSKEEVKKIVNKINEELDAVNGNKKLIEIYTKKIQRKLNNIWGI